MGGEGKAQWSRGRRKGLSGQEEQPAKDSMGSKTGGEA